MYSEDDVIVAQATPVQQRAPVAVIRVSGPGCWRLLGPFFKKAPDQPKPWQMKMGTWEDGDGLVDEVMLTFYRAPRSYTGQDMCEVFCHGNPLFVELILGGLIQRGARRARPGEFTMRAVLNGKMPLLKAEGLHDLIGAHTRYQADLVRRQEKGPLVGFIRDQVEEILQIQAHIEATIDYGEEDVDALQREDLLHRMDGMISRFFDLKQTAAFAKGLRRGFRVLITGEPNVGKSTLFNALVRQERAIVTELPGTTRDLISEEVEIRGLPVVLIDSAGVRDTDDRIENLGIEKIYRLLEDVDLVLYLKPLGSELQPYAKISDLPKHKWLEINTKSDLSERGEPADIAVSAKTGAGLEQLEAEIVVKLTAAFDDRSVYLINQRQEELVSAALTQLRAAREDYELGFGEEVLSSYLNTARRLLGELTGETTVEDVLDRMFANFCLGK